MNINLKDAKEWSKQVFGGCEFNDKRLTNRLVEIGSQLSSKPGASLSSSCDGSSSKLEGSYRFIRNERVKAEAIGAGGYKATAELSSGMPLLLAIEDTTTLTYSHEVRKELGLTGRYPDAYHRGYIVHSTLLVNAETETTVGLVGQDIWSRDKESYGKSHQRKDIAYEEKESYKWEKNSRNLEALFEERLSTVISVCDREADIYEYLQHKLQNKQRFIVRAKHDRILREENSKLFSSIEAAEPLGTYKVLIEQKGNRKKRQAKVELKARSITLTPPHRKVVGETELHPIKLNIVMAQEIGAKGEAQLQWFLLTTEDISNFDEARKITRYYELRWKIEDFHKAWKSGVNVEKQRMQSSENLEKMVVILSFTAVRLLQLKEHFEHRRKNLDEDEQELPCNNILSNVEWRVLWATVEKKKLPDNIPDAAWAFRAIAKLGGWTDSKRTGRAAWSTIWEGYFRLNERVEGYQAALALGEM